MLCQNLLWRFGCLLQFQSTMGKLFTSDQKRNAECLNREILRKCYFHFLINIENFPKSFGKSKYLYFYFQIFNQFSTILGCFAKKILFSCVLRYPYLKCGTSFNAKIKLKTRQYTQFPQSAVFTKFYFFNVLNPDEVEKGETPQVLPRTAINFVSFHWFFVSFHQFCLHGSRIWNGKERQQGWLWNLR